MYKFQKPATAKLDVWAEDLFSRCKKFFQGKRRLIFIYGVPDSSTFRYRVYNMIQAINTHSKTVSATWFSLAEVGQIVDLVPHAETIVICRVCFNEVVSGIITLARAHKVRVIFDCDDLVFDVGMTREIMWTLGVAETNANCDYWYAYIGRIQETLRHCDAGIASTLELAENMRRLISGPVNVIPNFLNQEQIKVSKEIMERKSENKFCRTEDIHLGYFSGTPSHKFDFDILTDVLSEILGDNPRVRIRFVGFIDSPKFISRFGSRIDRFSLTDYQNLQFLIGQTEVNLVPLQNNNFTKCKSNLKIFEAAAVGSFSVASDVPELIESIDKIKLGLISRQSEWKSMIIKAIQAVEDPEYSIIAAESSALALQHFSFERFGNAILNRLLPE
jgi:glycosyltransferase involved in cell wall biosynthesis